jgi:hypothetical protein
MKRARLILDIIALLLIVFQLPGYFGTTDKEPTKAQGLGLAAFYIGFNLPPIMAITSLIIAQYLKSKINKNEASDIIDSIGKN